MEGGRGRERKRGIYNYKCITRKIKIKDHFCPTQAPPPLPTSIKNTPQALALKTEATRRITQGNHENEYQQALGTIKEKIKETEGPDIKETMMDQIRQWFIECR